MLQDREDSPIDVLGTRDPDGVWRQLKINLILSFIFVVSASLYFHHIRFDFVISDLGEYIGWSQSPFGPKEFSSLCQHMPGYPALLYVFRGLTMGLMPAGISSVIICTSLFALTSWITTLSLIEACGPRSRAAAPLFLSVYMFFPFSGLAGVFFYGADMLAHLFIAVAILASLRKNWSLLMLAVAFGLFAHKVTWPFFLMLSIGCLARGYPIGKFLASGSPLVAYYFYYAIRLKDFTWILLQNVATEVKSKGTLPVLDDVVGSFHYGLTGTVQALLFVIIIVGSLICCYEMARAKKVQLFCVSLFVLILSCTINRRTAWAVGRFAKPLAVPAADTRCAAFIASLAGKRRNMLTFFVTGTLLLTQFVFAAHYVTWAKTLAGLKHWK